MKVTKRNNFDSLEGNLVYTDAASVFNVDGIHSSDDDYYDYVYAQGITPHTALYRHISELMNTCRIKRVRSLVVICGCRKDYCVSDVIVQLIEEAC